MIYVDAQGRPMPYSTPHRTPEYHQQQRGPSPAHVQPQPFTMGPPQGTGVPYQQGHYSHQHMNAFTGGRRSPAPAEMSFDQGNRSQSYMRTSQNPAHQTSSSPFYPANAATFAQPGANYQGNTQASATFSGFPGDFKTPFAIFEIKRQGNPKKARKPNKTTLDMSYNVGSFHMPGANTNRNMMAAMESARGSARGTNRSMQGTTPVGKANPMPPQANPQPFDMQAGAKPTPVQVLPASPPVAAMPNVAFPVQPQAVTVTPIVIVNNPSVDLEIGGGIAMDSQRGLHTAMAPPPTESDELYKTMPNADGLTEPTTVAVAPQKEVHEEKSRQNLAELQNLLEKLSVDNIAKFKKKQQTLINKLYKEAYSREEYQRELSKMYKEYEMRACTFTPTLHSRTKSAQRGVLNGVGASGPRKLETFFDDQSNHQKRVEDKIRVIQAEIDQRENKAATFRPEVLEKSARIVSKKSCERGAFHTRLFPSPVSNRIVFEASQMITKAEKTQLQESMEKSFFAPQINDVSKVMVSKTKAAAAAAQQEKKDDTAAPQAAAVVLAKARSAGKAASQTVAGKFILASPLREEKSVRRAGAGDKRETSKSPRVESRVENANSNKVLAAQFIRQFDGAWLEETNSADVKVIDKLGLVRILRRIGFLLHFSVELAMKAEGEAIEISHFAYQECILFRDMCNVLQNKARKRNVLTFLLAVLGLPYQEVTKSKVSTPLREREGETERGEAQHQPEQMHLGSYDRDGVLQLTAEEIKVIQQTYDLFYINRLNCEQERRKEATAISKRLLDAEAQKLASSHLSGKSRALADQHKQRIVQLAQQRLPSHRVMEINFNKISHVEMSALEKAIKQEMLIQKENERHQAALKECTFKPQLSVVPYFVEKPGERVGDMASTVRGTRRDRTKDEIEFEKHRSEYTFKPNTVKAKPEKKVVGKGHQRVMSAMDGCMASTQRNVNKSQFRVRDKENYNHEQEPRYEHNETVDKPTEVICVDINIGAGKIAQIYLSKSSDVAQIAEDFAAEHGLQGFVAQKLREMLRVQLDQFE